MTTDLKHTGGRSRASLTAAGAAVLASGTGGLLSPSGRARAATGSSGAPFAYPPSGTLSSSAMAVVSSTSTQPTAAATTTAGTGSAAAPAAAGNVTLATPAPALKAAPLAPPGTSLLGATATTPKQKSARGGGVPVAGAAFSARGAHLNPYALPSELAHRFKAVLEEALERLELLGLITAESHRRRDLPKANRKDIFALMLNQQKLEQAYAELMQRKNQLRGLSNKSNLARTVEDLKELSDALRESAATISQTLRDQPTSTGNLAKIQRDRSELQQLLLRTVAELRPHAQPAPSPQQLMNTTSGSTSGTGPHALLQATAASAATFVYLVEQVGAGLLKRDLLPKADARRKELKEEIAKYDTKLAEQKHRFDEEAKELNARIQEETRRLKSFREDSESSYRFEREQLLARAETLHRTRTQRLQQLQRELDASVEDRELDKIVTQRNREFLARRAGELDELARQWEAKHNKEASEMADALEKLSQARARDKAKLTYLQKREDKEVAFAAAKDAELERRRLEAEKHAVQLAIQNRAQLKIRFAWRVYHKKVGKQKKKKKLKKPKTGTGSPTPVPSFVNRTPRERRTAASVAASLAAATAVGGGSGPASARGGATSQNGLPLGSIAARALAVAQQQAAAASPLNPSAPAIRIS